MATVERAAIIDRKLVQPRRKLKTTMSLLLVLLMISIMATMVLMQSPRTDEPPPAAQSRARVSYVTHAPISIVGDSGFLGPNASTGITWGSGTTDDPYVIEGWDIDASAATGIMIQGTTMHFVIKGCYVHDGGSNWNGIYLNTCQNGDLEGNTCTGNWVGIAIAFSGLSTLTDNTCSGNFEGIYLIGSSGMTLTNNTCNGSNSEGLYLYQSNNNILAHNNCSSNIGYGIYLQELSGNNLLVNNNCSDNYHGIVLISSGSNSLSNNNCSHNEFNGIFLESSGQNVLSHNICANNSAGIYLYASSENILADNHCSGNNAGLYLVLSDGNTLSGLNCSFNYALGGIVLSTSSNNSLSLNQIRDNIGPGVTVFSGDNNMIWGNWFVRNSGSGSSYDPLHIQAYDAGLGNQWNSSGSGNYWSDWTTPDANLDGIVDIPYVLAGSAGAEDYYPVTTPAQIPEFGSFIVVVGLMCMIVVAAAVLRRPCPQ